MPRGASKLNFSAITTDSIAKLPSIAAQNRRLRSKRIFNRRQILHQLTDRRLIKPCGTSGRLAKRAQFRFAVGAQDGFGVRQPRLQLRRHLLARHAQCGNLLPNRSTRLVRFDEKRVRLALFGCQQIGIQGRKKVTPFPFLRLTHRATTRLPRRMRRKDLDIPFLGGVANLGSGMARFAREARVPIQPIVVRRVTWTRFSVDVLPPVMPSEFGDDAAVTAKVVGMFDAEIRKTPGQWFWYNSRWVLDPVK